MSSPEPLSEDVVRELAITARALVWRLRRFGEQEAGLTRLPQSEIEVLRALEMAPGSTVSEVARTLGLQSSNVSTTVRRLTERGLIERRASPYDGRSQLLYQSERARKNNRRIDDMWFTGTTNLLAQLAPADAEALVRAAPLLARLGELGQD